MDENAGRWSSPDRCAYGVFPIGIRIFAGSPRFCAPAAREINLNLWLSSPPLPAESELPVQRPHAPSEHLGRARFRNS